MLSRSSELVIVRASGVSVWQFLQPALLVGLLIGIFAITVYNPLAAEAKLRRRPCSPTLSPRKRWPEGKRHGKLDPAGRP